MEYISHEDYKKMMESFSKGTPKQSLNEGLEKEGNAFTAGLANAKKGEEFKVDGKSVKDTSNYDAPVKEEDIAKDTSGAAYNIGDQVSYGGHSFTIMIGAGGTAVLKHSSGKMIPHEQSMEILKQAAIDKKFGNVDEYQFDQMYPDDPGPFEGKDTDTTIKEDDVNWDRMDDEEAEENETDNGIEEGFSPDSSEFEQAIAKELEYLGDEELTDLEYVKALKALENPKVMDTLWGVDPAKAASALARMVRNNEVEEGLNSAPLQATGPTIQTVEKKHNLSKLAPQERDQLKQYVETIRTVKEEISKMLGKTKMKEGGDMTNLVMKPSTVSEEGEVGQGGDSHEAIEAALGSKHQVIHNAIDKIIETIKASGFSEGDAALFLQHEIEEKAKEYAGGQFDPH